MCHLAHTHGKLVRTRGTAIETGSLRAFHVCLTTGRTFSCPYFLFIYIGGSKLIIVAQMANWYIRGTAIATASLRAFHLPVDDTCSLLVILKR